MPFFRRVIAAVTEAEIAAALADPLVAQRFRSAVASPAIPRRTAFRCE
ncbi:hypothetical protein [Elioraea sp.]|nr:hypothetical protein [Elioraea sp.]